MSVINRTPLINEILSELTTQQLTTLKNCINGQGGSPVFRSLKHNSNMRLTESDKGVKPITIELNAVLGGMSVFEGYLIYTDDMCYVICYSGDKNQNLNILHINPTTREAELVNGSLTILELRSELDDTAEIGEGVTEQDVKGLIQADKDILSQIEVEYYSDETTFTFPYGIIPISYYDNELGILYCDYRSGLLITTAKIEEGELYLDENNKIVFHFYSERTLSEESGLLYINSNNPSDVININWYAILNPQPAGTKLYKHYITIVTQGGEIEFIIISNKSTNYNINDIKDTIFVGIDCVSISSELSSDLWLGNPSLISINGTGQSAKLIVTITSDYIWQSTDAPDTLTDTVTEL